MKNSFNLWKTWIVVSAIVGSLMIGWVLYAASRWALTTDSNFASWRTDAMLGNVLEAGDWNTLMTKLSLLWWVPKWAVMAFNLNECPDWWKDYNAANGRFIMGASSTYPFDSYWWNSQVYLQVANLPAHKHSLKMVVDWADVSDDIYMTSGIWNIPRQYEYDDDWGYAFVSTEDNFYWDKWFDDDYTSYNNWKSKQYFERTMKNEPFSVLPPYVTLKYCEKK